MKDANSRELTRMANEIKKLQAESMKVSTMGSIQ
jgi:hypothetical protein